LIYWPGYSSFVENLQIISAAEAWQQTGRKSEDDAASAMRKLFTMNEPSSLTEEQLMGGSEVGNNAACASLVRFTAIKPFHS